MNLQEMMNAFVENERKKIYKAFIHFQNYFAKKLFG